MTKGYLFSNKGEKIELDLSVFALIELERVIREDALSFLFNYTNNNLELTDDLTDDELLSMISTNTPERLDTANILMVLSNYGFELKDIEELGDVDYLILVKSLQHLLNQSFSNLVQSNEEYKREESKENEADQLPFITTGLQNLVLRGIQAGLTLNDSKNLNLGAWTDLVFTYTNLNATPTKGKPKTREANQEDINKFFGG